MNAGDILCVKLVLIIPLNLYQIKMDELTLNQESELVATHHDCAVMDKNILILIVALDACNKPVSGLVVEPLY